MGTEVISLTTLTHTVTAELKASFGCRKKKNAGFPLGIIEPGLDCIYKGPVCSRKTILCGLHHVLMGQCKKTKGRPRGCEGMHRGGCASIFKNGLTAEPKMILILLFTTQSLEWFHYTLNLAFSLPQFNAWQVNWTPQHNENISADYYQCAFVSQAHCGIISTSTANLWLKCWHFAFPPIDC